MKEMEPNRQKLFHADEAFSALGRALKDVSPDNPFKENLEKVQDEIGRARKNLEFEIAPEFTFKEPSSEFEGKVAEQIDNLIQLGFHVELGMTEDEYRASFPKFPNYSEVKSKRSKQAFTEPLVIDPRLTPNQLLSRTNITIKPEDLQSIEKQESDFEKKCPLKPVEKPYIAFICAKDRRGQGWYSKSIRKSVVRYLGEDSYEEGEMNLYEAAMFTTQNPVFVDGEVVSLEIPYSEFDETDPDNSNYKYHRTSEIKIESKLFSANAKLVYPGPII